MTLPAGTLVHSHLRDMSETGQKRQRALARLTVPASVRFCGPAKRCIRGGWLCGASLTAASAGKPAHESAWMEDC